MYELILTVMVKFSGPVMELTGGHEVSMLTRQYTVSVQGFASESACWSYTGYDELSKTLSSQFGAPTTVDTESPHCRPQPTSTTASN